MRINAVYRTAILQMDPDKKMAAELKRSMTWVQEFLSMSRTEIQMLLYNKWKEMNIPMSTRITAQLSVLATGALFQINLE